MIKKAKKYKKSNPIAKDLRTPKYRQQLVKSKKIYNRKKKTINQKSSSGKLKANHFASS